MALKGFKQVLEKGLFVVTTEITAPGDEPAEEIADRLTSLIGRVDGISFSRDDQDEDAIDKRHDIYYDTKTGTMAAVNHFKELSKVNNVPRIIELDGKPGVKEVSSDLLNKLK